MSETTNREDTHREKELIKIRKYCRENGMKNEYFDIPEGEEVIDFIEQLKQERDKLKELIHTIVSNHTGMTRETTNELIEKELKETALTDHKQGESDK
jgi:chemotaxis methyl-accepting protein methylase